MGDQSQALRQLILAGEKLKLALDLDGMMASFGHALGHDSGGRRERIEYDRLLAQAARHATGELMRRISRCRSALRSESNAKVLEKWYDLRAELEGLAADQGRPNESSAVAQSALRAVVDGGLAGVLRTAGTVKSATKVSEQMLKMLGSDHTRYGWSAEAWATQLGCAKQTIVGNKKQGVPPCEAWKQVLAKREAGREAKLET